MKKNSLYLINGLFFTVFAIALYFFLTPNPLRETQSTKKQSQSNRLLELGLVQDQTTSVEDEPSALFNDPAIKQAWGLKKSDAARAWSVSQGSKEVIVAIIDTGIDINHEDLKGNLWVNQGESGKDAKGKDKATNGIDDDQNGFIDDVNGWNFVSNNPRLTDNHGHGTHIAGIVGAEAANGKGISGISPKVSLMILKYYDPKVPNTDNLKNTVASIQYAVKMGAHIINYSGGGIEYSQEEFEAVQAAEKKGILFVAAAGNERSNSDQNHYYPADYPLKNIISVTAIDPTTEVLSSSNYGVQTVDIAAPGQNILSCLPNNSYGLMTGTSQATAFVTGAATLIISHKKQYFKAEEIKKYVLATGDTSSSLLAKTKTSRQLNLFKALTILGNETGFSGTAKAKVENKFLSESNAESDRGTDPNMDNVSNVASFGKQLLKNLGQQNNRKKPSANAVAEDPNAVKDGN
ncbi:MAG: Serine protease/subtilase [Pseudobdellovibrio sp.]|jgi:subtilisin family serine protease|nr:Serine protease/subtilase [Pseudobdellovibrio sp.]